MPSTKIDSPDVEPQTEVEKTAKSDTPTKKSIEEKPVETKESNGAGEKDDNKTVETEKVETEKTDVAEKVPDEKPSETDNGDSAEKVTPSTEEKVEKDQETEDGKRKSIGAEGDKDVTPKKLKTDAEENPDSEDVTSSA